MCLLLTLLLLTPLLVPPVFSQNYQSFLRQHTYIGNTLVDCNRDLNPILQSLNKQCKPCNTFILGDQRYTTAVNDVDAVCGSGGVPQGNKKYESIRTFRVVKCREKTPGRQPPNCDYRKVGQKNIQNKKITLTCENNRPVHFNPC